MPEQGALVNRHNVNVASVVAGSLAALTFLVHGSALQGGWRVDDPKILLYLIEYPNVFGYFFSPAQWQQVAAPFFTPWHILDYWLDYTLFGFNPQAFYAHHLSFVWLAALLTFVLLLRNVGPLWAGAASALFLSGSPVAIVSQQLMSRHYVTGLVFAILCILFWLHGRRTARRSLMTLSAVFYLVAMLNKEIYAPLPLALFFLDSALLRSRLRAMLPFFLAAVLFIVWRAAMLGKLIGGYGNGFPGIESITASLLALPRVFFGEGWLALAGSLVVLSAACLLLRRLPKHAPAGLFAAVIALSLPFLAIRVSLSVIDMRFAFLPWWGACVLLALGFGGALRQDGTGMQYGSARQRAGRYSALLATAVLFLVATTRNLEAAREHAAIAAEFDVQGRFLWDRNDAASYVPAGNVGVAPQFQYAMSALKMASLQTPTPVAVPFAESAPVLAGSRPIYSYDPACRCMREEPAPPGALATPHKPFSMGLSMERPGGGLVWNFSVPADAACYLAYPGLNAALIMPCSGQLLFTLPSWLRGAFRFFARTAGGQWNVSPPLIFPEEGQKLKWSTERTPDSNFPN